MDYFARITQDHEQAKWKVLARTPEVGEWSISNKVQAIKAFRDLYKAGLKEAKDTVEEYTRRLAAGEPVGFDLPEGTKVVNFPGGYLTIIAEGERGGYSIYKTITEKVWQNIPEADLLQYVGDAMRDIGHWHSMPRAMA